MFYANKRTTSLAISLLVIAVKGDSQISIWEKRNCGFFLPGVTEPKSAGLNENFESICGLPKKPIIRVAAARDVGNFTNLVQFQKSTSIPPPWRFWAGFSENTKKFFI